MKKIFALILAVALTLSLSFGLVYASDDPDPHVIKPIVEVE